MKLKYVGFVFACVSLTCWAEGEMPAPVANAAISPAATATVSAPVAAPSSAPEVSTPIAIPPSSGGVTDYRQFRDPFKQLSDGGEDGPERSDLELYATSEFRLTGVITGPLRMRAILISPKGKSFIVNQGTKIGIRAGTIKKITTRSIIVDEQGTNELGEIERADVEIELEDNLAAGKTR